MQMRWCFGSTWELFSQANIRVIPSQWTLAQKHALRLVGSPVTTTAKIICTARHVLIAPTSTKEKFQRHLHFGRAAGTNDRQEFFQSGLSLGEVKVGFEFSHDTENFFIINSPCCQWKESWWRKSFESDRELVVDRSLKISMTRCCTYQSDTPMKSGGRVGDHRRLRY